MFLLTGPWNCSTQLCQAASCKRLRIIAFRLRHCILRKQSDGGKLNSKATWDPIREVLYNAVWQCIKRELRNRKINLSIPKINVTLLWKTKHEKSHWHVLWIVAVPTRDFYFLCLREKTKYYKVIVRETYFSNTSITENGPCEL